MKLVSKGWKLYEERMLAKQKSKMEYQNEIEKSCVIVAIYAI